QHFWERVAIGDYDGGGAHDPIHGHASAREGGSAMSENTHALTFSPGPSPLEFSPCPVCGMEVDGRGVHACGPRRPTYDELALAVREFARLQVMLDDSIIRDLAPWDRAAETLLDLARRLEPGR